LEESPALSLTESTTIKVPRPFFIREQ